MSVLVAIILGIVQGLTEFLPVSSSGHLVLLEQLLGIREPQILFDIILHLATLCAVVIVFFKPLLNIIKNPFKKQGKMLMLATGITLVIAFLFEDFFKSAFSGGLLAFSFLITACFLFIAEYVAKNYKSDKELNYKNTAIMGLFQGIAIMPGISRSGSTISSAIVQGIKKEKAAEFSFIMSIPIILASLVWELISAKEALSNISVLPTILGFLAAFISGFFAIKIMLKIISRAKYSIFGVYLTVLGVVLMLNQYIFGWF